MFGVPRLRQLWVFRCVDDVFFRHVIIARVAKWLDGRVLVKVSNARK